MIEPVITLHSSASAGSLQQSLENYFACWL